MQCWRRDDVDIAHNSTNSLFSDRFHLKEKNFLRKIYFTINIIHRKPRNILKTDQIEAKIAQCESIHSQWEQKLREKTIFRRKIQILDWMIFLVTLISPNSTRFSGNLHGLEQELSYIHSFAIIFFL